jgi:hypothetical protein
MLCWSLLFSILLAASDASAGTIKLHAATPMTYRLDGEFVGRLVTDVTLTDVPEGAHRIEVVDGLGKVLASTDVILREDEPLWFEYSGRRLLEVDHVERPTGSALTEAQYKWVEHRIYRKRRDDKKLKRLNEVVDRYYFEMRHVDQLLAGFPTLDARVAAAKLLAPRTLDPEKVRAIEDHFPPGPYRDAALGAFEMYK